MAPKKMTKAEFEKSPEDRKADKKALAKINKRRGSKASGK